jgi:AraC-like DNA-binding protein
MTDRLAALMVHFPVSAHVFNAGALCGINTLPGDGIHGQLHLISSGAVTVRYGKQSLHIDQPSLLLFPRPLTHRFITDPERGADMVCANLLFEGGSNNPIALGLPEVVCLPLTVIADAGPILELLFLEAFEQRCGRVAVIERLFEVVMIQVLRQLMESGEVRSGLLAGLSHPRLRNALVAMHETPAQEWTLEQLASQAGMSRSVFASTFRETVGVTSGQYLQSWRVRLVQKALLLGRPLKMIVDEVGYGSEAALSRAFKAQTGQSPREWKNQHQAASNSESLTH